MSENANGSGTMRVTAIAGSDELSRPGSSSVTSTSNVSTEINNQKFITSRRK